MQYLRRHKRSWAWLAIVALLSHALALGVPAGAPSADSVLGPLVICTADGARAAQGDGAPQGLPAAGHCLACLLSVQPALAVALTAFPIAFAPAHTARPQATGTSAVAVHLVIGGIHSRGPPHAA